MIGLLAQQLLAIGGCLLLLGIPGWALSRLLELHLRVPTVALPVVYFTFGLTTWSVLLVPSLAFGWPVRTTLVLHAIASILLIVATKLREARRGHAKQGSDAFSGWTLAAIALAVLAALGLRTRIAFDSLFHLGMVRRLLELDAPTFENVDRVVGAGVNPAYVLPAWQSAMAGVAAVTGLDPATVLEAMSVVGVLLAACAAASLGRVITCSVAGEVAGAAAYGWLRVFYPRRELEGDGIAYAALPGNVALDVFLPLTLVVALLFLRRRANERGNRALALLGCLAVVLLVLLHANYVVYVAIIGVGMAAWMLVAGPWSRAIGRRLVATAALVAVPGAIALAVLLPLLATLEHFGAPLDARIDYHLSRVGGWELIRPGHLYDWFAVPGLLGVLVLPWAAWRARGVSRALIGGGSLALLAFALAPPLVDLLGMSGSLTLSLRLPRPLGVLLVAAAAVAIPDLVAHVRALATRVDLARGRWAGRAVLLVPFALVAAMSALYGYPQARKEPADYGWNWPTIAAVAGLLVVLVLLARRRLRGRVDDLGDVTAGTPVGGMLTTRAHALAILALAACMLPSGITSMRRAGWHAEEVVPAWRADDLKCFDGVAAALRRLPSDEVLLADPVTAYGAQALAATHLVADYKVWNGSTDSARIERRMQLLRATFDAQVDERAGMGLARLAEDFEVRYVLVAEGEVAPPIGTDLAPYDAIGLRALLEDEANGATRVAAGSGRLDDDAEPEERAACDLVLWKLDGSERRLEAVRDVHHA